MDLSVVDSLLTTALRRREVGDKGACPARGRDPILWSSRRGSAPDREIASRVPVPARWSRTAESGAVPSGHFVVPLCIARRRRRGEESHAVAEQWTLQLEPQVLIPGRTVRASITFVPEVDIAARGVRAALRCTERWRYDTTQSSTGADGRSHTRRVTRTGEEELAALEWHLAGATTFVRGQPEAWSFEIEVPGLGPASFEGEELRCDWTLEVVIDRPHAFDARNTWQVHVAQPTALLSAGVVDTGMYGLFDEAPANVEALPAQIRLSPVPLNLWAPFTGSFTVETAAPIQLQEVRLELRVAVQVTVRGGRGEVIRIGSGRLEPGPVSFGGPLATHEFSGDAPGAWLPSLDLPHGRARGAFHVILAEAWARDTHYQRDVALATTAEV